MGVGLLLVRAVVLALRVHWQQSLAARGVYMVNFQLIYSSAGGFQLVHIGRLQTTGFVDK
jgi:hypothetical protein